MDSRNNHTIPDEILELMKDSAIDSIVTHQVKNNIDKEIGELNKFAEMEGSEIGEMCLTLIHIMSYSDYIISHEFEQSVKKEILYQLDNFKEHSQIVEKEETTTQKWKELVWIESI